MARAVGTIATLVTLVAPAALFFEPYPYIEDHHGAWVGVAGLLPLLGLALWTRRGAITAIAVAHALWLVGGFLAFSTVGEIWCCLSVFLCNVSAIASAAIYGALWASDGREMTPQRYGLAFALGLGGVLAAFGAARGLWDGARWAMIHHEADRLAAHARAHGDAEGYTQEIGWAYDSLRHGPHDCRDGSDGYSISYSVATRTTSHWITTCPGEDAWFYYPD